ncbi:MAG: OmpA family protein, partial [Polyangiales bacterium]
MRGSAALAAGMLMLLVPAAVHAQEPWLLSAEGGYLQPLTEPQRDLFQPGFTGSVALHRSLVPWVSLGVQLRGGLLFDGDPPADPGRVDPGHGSLATLSLAVRVRPLADPDDPRRGTGLWLEAAGGGGLTGDLGRGAIEGAVGWGFEAGAVDLGPVVRYVQVVDGQSTLDSRDARMLVVGAEIVLFDPRPKPAPPPAEPEGPSDRDGDGILDPDDECPDEPEDVDGFEDEDGCPDPDNDEDGILDEDDECPLEPEDVDGFEDEDGCPDPDNDGDGILDVDDECPDEPEVVNGVDDEDGCPDEGLVELVDDRIILEERVLFDSELAKLRPSAREVLQAIVRLWRQHPEWAEMRVEGHADARGTEEYNEKLSERRARVVRNQLVKLGIPGDQLGWEGFGETRLRDSRYTDEAHQRNRRVEFVVVSRRPSSQNGGAAAGAGHTSDTDDDEETAELDSVSVEP